MTHDLQQEAVNLLAEAAQRLGNHVHTGLSKELMRQIHKLLERVEDATGMTNIPQVADDQPDEETRELAKRTSWEVRRAAAKLLTPHGSTNPREDWRCQLNAEIELSVYTAILKHGGLPTGPNL